MVKQMPRLKSKSNCKTCNAPIPLGNRRYSYCSEDCKNDRGMYGSLYGITRFEAKVILENKTNCEICDIKFDNIKKGAHRTKACIDHDHKTGVIRGIICGNCNFGLGNFKDNIELIEKAIKYLEENKNV